MLRRLSSIFIILLLSAAAQATHIVGGEFNLVWKARGTNYELSLNLYFDEIHGSPNLKDPGITVYIYEKGTNTLVTPYGVPLTLKNSSEMVDYVVPNCTQNNLSTSILRYVTGIDLANFTHPEGYYVVWERCCRNELIDNIEYPLEAGMVFYLEFPPVTKMGRSFKNSSPQFREVEGEFFCPDKDQVYDFSATDANGDSLVYSLVSPFIGYSGGYHAAPVPRPYSNQYPYGYPEVNWKPGYNRANMIPGEPSLSIDRHTGRLHVKPTEPGLYVMAVMVEEYRNGERIGVSRRDFQFQVLEECPENEDPMVKLRDSENNYLSENDTLVVPFGEEDLCYFIEVSDSSVYLDEEESITINTKGTLPSSVYSLSGGLPKLTLDEPVSVLDLCFSNCRSITLENDSVFELKVIAGDDACPMPITDTLTIKVLVEGMKNSPPEIGLAAGKDNYQMHVGDTINFVVYGKDSDADDILKLAMENGAEGMEFSSASGKDSIAGTFRWKVDCENYKNSPYNVSFRVSDESCSPSKSDTNAVEISIVDYPTEIADIRPTNLITPNNDGLNDYYHIPNMPKGNCTYFFASIKIYNRWGGLVYESGDTNFKWNASNAPEGLYYYQIDLNEKQLKGWLQVVR